MYDYGVAVEKEVDKFRKMIEKEFPIRWIIFHETKWIIEKKL